MLIAEDLALLLAEGDTGASGTATPRGEHSLAGALLIELAMLDRVDVTGATDPADLADTAPRTAAPDEADGADGVGSAGRTDGAGAPDPPTTGRLVVRDPAPTGHSALDSALAVLATLESARPKDAVGALAKEAVSTDLRRVPERGIPDLDRLRARVREVLLDGREPDERTTALIALLTGTDAVGGALGPDGAGDVERAAGRAARIAEGNGGGDPLRGSVEEITATVLAGLLVPLVTVPGPDPGPGGADGDGAGDGATAPGGVGGGGAGADHGLS